MLSMEQMRAEERRTSSVSDNRYAKLEADMEKQNQSYIDSNRQKQNQIIRAQDNQLEAISKGITLIVYSIISLVRTPGDLIQYNLVSTNTRGPYTVYSR